MRWLPNDSTDHAGYDFSFSYDNENWAVVTDISNSLTPEDTTYVYDGFPNNSTIYFRLTAYDYAAFTNYSDPSDAYGVRLAETGADLLIVDGFDRMDGYWQESFHTYVYQSGTIFSGFDLAFNTCSDDAIIDGKVFLEDYSIVVYLLGDESGENKVLISKEQEALKSFLQNGGKLIISGSEIGSDLNTMGTAEDQQFYQTYLKSEFLADSAHSLQLIGASGTFFEDYTARINPPAGTSYKSDIISPLGSEAILNFDDGSGAGIYFSGMFEGGSMPGQLAHFSFPIELINDEEGRKELLGRVLELFGVVSSVQAPAYSGTPINFELFNNYPNPFNPSTVIRWRLPVESQVELSIYSISGEKVVTLVSERQTAGRHQIVWDARDVASGVYYYRIQTGKFEDVKKMVLFR